MNPLPILMFALFLFCSLRCDSGLAANNSAVEVNPAQADGPKKQADTLLTKSIQPADTAARKYDYIWQGSLPKEELPINTTHGVQGY
ncbi:MAG TPA: hypothetical protein ENJ95_12405 [Bacteroidetes bacterium]|nr:hypothetical protein [Bacteroidota bacterium]